MGEKFNRFACRGRKKSGWRICASSDRVFPAHSPGMLAQREPLPEAESRALSGSCYWKIIFPSLPRQTGKRRR